MEKPSIQAPSSVIMIRPHHFSVNTQTGDNVFQANPPADGDIAQQAYDEATRSAEILRQHGVLVHVFEGEDPRTPDCVFPNNWFSTHAGGHVAVYPMKAPNRRLERRTDVIELLKQEYRVQDIIDYSGLEQDNLFLEGTGAMVIDHADRVAYAVESDRTSPILLERFCTHFNYEPMAFAATDRRGVPVYHSNVLMCIGTDYALIGAEMISDEKRRQEVVDRLAQPGREVIDLSHDQIEAFAGNAIELQGKNGRILALSQTAFDALSDGQKTIIEKSAGLVPLPIPTIEMAGGSVRCTIAGVHLARR
ncbi:MULTISPECIES: citrulline utilization hydrolase CtlX [unclassified Ruegeria]|uniref:citrulline utilization hydrolase CtlX n=1 Tax=unclassified Ruegeria TaxID=2625375 RepID=UPI001489E5A6|nr:MULTISPECIES: arginine deiminase-related protein [unclassified Ruegeria]